MQAQTLLSQIGIGICLRYLGYAIGKLSENVVVFVAIIFLNRNYGWSKLGQIKKKEHVERPC